MVKYGNNKLFTVGSISMPNHSSGNQNHENHKAPKTGERPTSFWGKVGYYASFLIEDSPATQQVTSRAVAAPTPDAEQTAPLRRALEEAASPVDEDNIEAANDSDENTVHLLYDDAEHTLELTIPLSVTPQVEYLTTTRVSASTNASEKHPGQSDDRYVVVDKPGTGIVAGVFDGVGSKSGSEKAAMITAAAVEAVYGELYSERMTLDQAKHRAKLTLEKAKEAIDNTGEDISTTAAVVSLHTDPETDKPFAAIAWAGDSRVVIIRDGKSVYRTRDDGFSLLLPELDAQFPREEPEYRMQAFFETATEVPYGWERIFKLRKDIYNCIGSESTPDIHTDTVDTEPGDIILITTDGIHDNLTTQEILDTINMGDGPSGLIKAAKIRSGDRGHIRAKADDMTAVIVRA